MLILDLTQLVRAKRAGCSDGAALVPARLARLSLRLEQRRAKMSVGIRKDPNQKSYDVSADLVIMAGWLHPIPFRTRP
jgi:hypothetical protein